MSPRPGPCPLSFTRQMNPCVGGLGSERGGSLREKGVVMRKRTHSGIHSHAQSKEIPGARLSSGPDPVRNQLYRKITLALSL